MVLKMCTMYISDAVQVAKYLTSLLTKPPLCKVIHLSVQQNTLLIKLPVLRYPQLIFIATSRQSLTFLPELPVLQEDSR